MVANSNDTDLKIVDFGLSKIIGPNESSLDPFGTLSYVAPEVLLQKPYGKEVDLWSLGVIIYLLLSRVLPFDDEEDKEIARQTIQDAPDFSFEPWDEVSAEGKDLVKSKCFFLPYNPYLELLEKNRQKRPSLEEVLQHKWFSGFKEIMDKRKGSQKDAEGVDNKFEAFTLLEPNSPKMTEDIKQLEKDQKK